MNQFEEFENRPAACQVCEMMLPDAVDSLLSDAEQRAFDKHVAGCVECSRELAEAQRGAAWLGMLKSQSPEPPAGLLAKILAETTGAAQTTSQNIAQDRLGSVVTPASSRPSWETAHHPVAMKPKRVWGSQWAALQRQIRDVFSIESARATFQPRIAMTTAMAFFSIALTLNLTGVRLRDIRPSNLTPSALKRTVADVDASAMRLFQNNRAVYQVESRLSELRNNAPGD